MTVCPGCGAEYDEGADGFGGHDAFIASDACWHALGVVTATILRHPDELAVWHQTHVDAFTLQHLAPDRRAVQVAFALNGLYLVVARGWTGLQAQAAHVHLARTFDAWTPYPQPDDVGSVTAADVRTDGPAECAADVKAWGVAVWDAWSHVHDAVAAATDAQLAGWHPPASRSDVSPGGTAGTRRSAGRGRR